jgi:integrase
MGYVQKHRGKYRARYRDPAGRMTSRTFVRKTDADRFVRELVVEHRRGSWIEPRGADQPLTAWAAEFLALSRRLAPKTQETYRRDIERYILPRFGRYRIGLLPPDEIENWLNDEVAAGLAPSSVHRHYRTLRRMLQVAVDKQRLLANPCDRVQPPRVPKREMVFLNWEQTVDLAEAHRPRFRALIYVAVDTGMRWSELIGLRRSKVDLRLRKIRVTEQLLKLESGEWVREEPKTSASVRSITIAPFTAELLAEHVESFTATGVDGLVFPNAAGGPITSQSFLSNHFKPAREEVGLPCRFHDLRHTSVALAIAEGAHPKAIQARMGHSSINVTLDRYGHLFPELDEAIATSFGKRFSEAHRVRSGGPVVHASFDRSA